MQYGCEEELNWALLFRLTKDSDKLHNLQTTSANKIVICADANCQTSLNTFDSTSNDIIQELYDSNEFTEMKESENLFNDFNHYNNTQSVEKDSMIEDDLEENGGSNTSFSSDFKESSEVIDSVKSVEEELEEECRSDSGRTELDVPNNETESQILEDKVRKYESRHFVKIELSVEEQKSSMEIVRKSKTYVEAEFKCYSCALGFLFKDSYQTHMVRHEESNGQYMCSLCSLRFATANARRMHSVLHAIRYVCSICDSVITSARRKKHMQDCWKEGMEPAPCHLCGKIFKDNSGLQQHLKRLHSVKSKKHVHTCNICGKKYAEQSRLRTHLIVHTNRVFKCPYCDRTYTNPYTLAQHKHSHTQSHAQNYFCDLCQTYYATKKLLRQHIKNGSAHQQFSYECPACTRSYATHKSLQTHIQTIHSALKPYACGSCPARYSTKKSLVRHNKIHSHYVQGKMFICDICGKCYRGKSKLLRHIRDVCERNRNEQLSIFNMDNIL